MSMEIFNFSSEFAFVRQKYLNVPSGNYLTYVSFQDFRFY